jgi:hypothetical protein
MGYTGILQTPGPDTKRTLLLAPFEKLVMFAFYFHQCQCMLDESKVNW